MQRLLRQDLAAGRDEQVEDDELDLSRHLLFSVERMLKANGGIFVRSEKNWQPHVVEDGALITGQNPASAGPIAEVFANRLN